MLFEIVNGNPVPLESAEALLAGHQAAGFFDAEEVGSVLPEAGLTPERLLNLLDNDAMSYENHDRFDLIRLNLPSRAAHPSQKDRVCICLLQNRIFFFSRDAARFAGLLPELQDGKELPAFDRLPVVFFERLTANDPQHLEKLEREISALEDKLLTGGGKNAVKEIVSLRRRLSNMKHYYEQLLDVLDGLLENGNGLLSETALRSFRIFDGRTDRQYHSILHSARLCHPGAGGLSGGGGHQPKPRHEDLHRNHRRLPPADADRGLVRHEPADAGIYVALRLSGGDRPVPARGRLLPSLF